MATIRELDVRMYGADGKRLPLPSFWIESIDFEINEEGGYGQGTLKVHEAYAGGFQTFEVERIDVRMWGQLVYRGFLRISQTDTSGQDQSANPTLYGMIEVLGGYLVRRKYSFVAPVSPEVLFTAIVNDYVAVAGRQPGIVIDTTGVSALGLVIQQYDATGKTAAQAMNDLVSLFPQQIIWGCDVDGSGNDRIYLRPRSKVVKYRFSEGRDVKAMLYPRDATQVVNTLLVTGAQLDGSGYPPNLCPNGSFEDSAIPGEKTSNLLQNPGFDLDNGGTQPGGGWGNQGDPSVDGSYGRSSPNAAVLDNNPSAEAIFQDVNVSDGLPCHASCWALVIPTETWRFRMILTYYDASGTVLDSITGAWQTPAADNVYRHYQLDWPSPSASGAARLRFRLETDPANSGAHGLDVDDCALWVDQVSATDWQPGLNSGANFTTLDWANSEIEPYDGGTVVKLQANITGGAGSYAQIRTNSAQRIQVKQHLSYVVSAWIWAANGTTVQAAIGARTWAGTTPQGTTVGSVHTWTSIGQWELISYVVTTVANSDGMDVILRFYNGAVVYVDAVSVFENAVPDPAHLEIYYPGDTFTAKRAVTDYSSPPINADAAASITNFGIREAAVTNTNVYTLADLDDYCALYFNAHATSLVNAGLTLFAPTAPVYLDGKVQIVNLPVPPPPLFAANVRYRIDAQGIEMTIDLNNKQPDLALLLREIQEGTR